MREPGDTWVSPRCDQCEKCVPVATDNATCDGDICQVEWGHGTLLPMGERGEPGFKGLG